MKKAPVKKEPTKVQRFKLWTISNYGEETLEFKEDEVLPGMTFNFFDCNKTKIIIHGKCKNVMMSKCKRVDISIQETMSMVEVLNSEDCKLRVGKKIPTVSVEKTNCIQFFVNEQSKDSLNIVTTASQGVSLTYPKPEGTFDPNDSEEETEKMECIPETFVTKLKNGKIETVAQEGLD